MQSLLGAAAAVLTWLGWVTICPALGFPTLGTAAMVNRVFFPNIPEAGHNPNFWVGWVILIAGLLGASAAFFALERARLGKPGIRTGLIYGAALWLLAGLVIMPLLGLLGPPTYVSGFQPADTMQATVMMYRLGPFASLAALIGWLLFGAILGASGRTAVKGHGAVAAAVAGLAMAFISATAVHALAQNSTPSGVTVRTLAQGPVQKLPGASVFVSILEFRQVPGADFGPHAHVAAFVYTVHGVATISSPGAADRSVGPGEAAFIPALAVHTHNNVNRRIEAAGLALGVVVVVILLCAATWLHRGLRTPVMAGLSLVLIAGGALLLSGATANDYLLIALRPDTHQDAPMPRPDGTNIFASPASPDMNPAPAAPCLETLSAIGVPPGARYDAPNLPGPQTIIVIEGTAAVHVGGVTQQLRGGHSVLAQEGTTLAVVNPGSDTLRVLDFAVTPLSAVTTTP
jgi:quercetin dioxygenase-like cupin family protein